MTTSKNKRIEEALRKYFLTAEVPDNKDLAIKRYLFEFCLKREYLDAMLPVRLNTNHDIFHLSILARRQDPALEYFNAAILAFGRMARKIGYFGCVYMIQHKATGRTYIGQTTQHFHLRMDVHVDWGSDDWRDYHKANTPLYLDMRAFGVDAFTTRVLEVVWRDLEIPGLDKRDEKKRLAEALNDLERKYISLYGARENGYNLTLGGKGTREVRPEARAKGAARVSLARYGHYSLLRQALARWMGQLGVPMIDIGFLLGYKSGERPGYKASSEGKMTALLDASLLNFIGEAYATAAPGAAASAVAAAYERWVEVVVRTENGTSLAFKVQAAFDVTEEIVEVCRQVLLNTGVTNNNDAINFGQRGCRRNRRAYARVYPQGQNNDRHARLHSEVADEVSSFHRYMNRRGPNWFVGLAYAIILLERGVPVAQIQGRCGFTTRSWLDRVRSSSCEGSYVRYAIPHLIESLGYWDREGRPCSLGDYLDRWAAECMEPGRTQQMLVYGKNKGLPDVDGKLMDMLESFVTGEGRASRLAGPKGNQLAGAGASLCR